MSRGKIALYVAEKPSVAKSIADLLGGGRFQKYMGKSKFNPIFEFDYHVNGEQCKLRVTSVLGHIMGLKYPDHCKNWQSTPMESLYEVALEKVPIENSQKVVENLIQYSRDIDHLVIWTDCDREGEAIGYDIIDVCRKRKPNIKIHRAHFSALTKQDIERAANNLTPPNKFLADAVHVRQEIDLRIGATFTRFQTLLLRDTIQKQGVISYGPCQFPTLGFIVERHQQIEKFIPEKFWQIHMKFQHQTQKDQSANFLWNRNRVFDKFSCLVLYEMVMESEEARVISVAKNKKIRYRPYPLNTVEAQKLISRKLRISPEQAMQHMEKLYNKGFLSYPRTETTRYNPTINLFQIVQKLTNNQSFGEFASKVASKEMWSGPKRGRNDDKAHPPIHPVKNAERDMMSYDEWRIYDIVTRHFLATISKDAELAETQVKVAMGGELFHSKGVSIEKLNWLEVFHWDKQMENELPSFKEGQTFMPKELKMNEGITQAPKHLTESDLITKMNNTGIGTDATIHEHIKNVQDREYVRKQSIFLVPTRLGLSLVEVYAKMGIDLYKPFLRAQMESDMKAIADGRKTKQEIYTECLNEMRKIFVRTHGMSQQFKNFFAQRFQSSENANVDRQNWGGNESSTQQGPNSGPPRGDGNQGSFGKYGSAQNNYSKHSPAQSNKSPRGRKNGGATGYGKHSPINTGSNSTHHQSNNSYHNQNQSHNDSFSGLSNNHYGSNAHNSGNQQQSQERPAHLSALDHTYFMTCPQCNSAKLRLRLAKTNQNLFVACSGYPQCQNTMNMPKGVSNISMLDDNCPKCLKRDKKNVKLFTIEFNSILVNELMAQSLPLEDNTAGTFCIFVGCDTGYSTLLEETRTLPNQKTFGGEQLVKTNPDGIPPYYYQKPEVTSVANGGGPEPKRSKKDVGQRKSPKAPSAKAKAAGEGIGKNGCSLCGKKAHRKTNNCPNNPAYQPLKE